MKNKFYLFLAKIQFKIDEYLTSKGYYDDIYTTLDKDFWEEFE